MIGILVVWFTFSCSVGISERDKPIVNALISLGAPPPEPQCEVKYDMGLEWFSWTKYDRACVFALNKPNARIFEVHYGPKSGWMYSEEKTCAIVSNPKYGLVPK